MESPDDKVEREVMTDLSDIAEDAAAHAGLDPETVELHHVSVHDYRTGEVSLVIRGERDG